LGELTKDLDAFYTMFIQQFQAIEREMTHERHSSGVSSALEDGCFSLVTP